MNRLYLVETKASVMPSAYVEEMANTSLGLLNAQEGKNISLLLGFAIHVDNKAALCCWFQSYMGEHPGKVNFKKHLFPALLNHLKECEQELMRASD